MRQERGGLGRRAETHGLQNGVVAVRRSRGWKWEESRLGVKRARIVGRVQSVEFIASNLYHLRALVDERQTLASS